MDVEKQEKEAENIYEDSASEDSNQGDEDAPVDEDEDDDEDDEESSKEPTFEDSDDDDQEKADPQYADPTKVHQVKHMHQQWGLCLPKDQMCPVTIIVEFLLSDSKRQAVTAERVIKEVTRKSSMRTDAPRKIFVESKLSGEYHFHVIAQRGAAKQDSYTVARIVRLQRKSKEEFIPGQRLILQATPVPSKQRRRIPAVEFELPLTIIKTDEAEAAFNKLVQADQTKSLRPHPPQQQQQPAPKKRKVSKSRGNDNSKKPFDVKGVENYIRLIYTIHECLKHDPPAMKNALAALKTPW